MAAKSLSTSTLSLKFMQNAHRAKQLKEVELDRAEVKDDGKWEVSKEIRDSWVVSKETQHESSDVHESSYLPFLFSAKSSVANDGANSTVQNPSGRRSFNKKGEDVSLEVSGSDSKSAHLSPPSAAPPSSSGRKVHPRPISISASGTSGQLRGFEQLKTNRDTKTARDAIFESGGVGTDLRTRTHTDETLSSSTHATSSTFIKPAGIDDPKDLQTGATAGSSKSDSIINSARQKKVKREREREREREGVADEPSDVGPKPKKKKKKTPE